MNFQTQMETIEDSEESDAESAPSVGSQANTAAVEQDNAAEGAASDRGKTHVINDAQSEEEEEEDDDTVVAVGGDASSSASSSPATDKKGGRGARATQEIRLEDSDAIAKKAAAAKGALKNTPATQQSDVADSHLGSAAVVPSSGSAGKISKTSNSASRQGLKGVAAAKRPTNADQPDADIGVLLDIGALSSSSDEENNREGSDDDYVPPGSQVVSKAKRRSSATPHLSPKKATQKKPAPAAASDDMLVIGAGDAGPASSLDEDSDGEQAAASDVTSEDAEVQTRKRRAPSNHRLTSDSDSEEEEGEAAKARGRRGAPRKTPRLDAAAAAGASSPPLLAKAPFPGPRGRGRPRGSVGPRKPATATQAAAAAATAPAAKSRGRGGAAAQASGSVSTLDYSASQANDMAEAPQGTRDRISIVSEDELARKEAAADKAADSCEGATSPPLLAGAASSAYGARKGNLAGASRGSGSSLGESSPSRKLSKTEAALFQLRHNRALWDLKFTSQVERWSTSAVAKWLRENGFDGAASQALAAGVDGEVFLEIEEDMLSDLGISSALQRRRFDVLRRRLCVSGPS
jgi:hypothetical protein